MQNLEQKIEAILFYKGEPVSRKKLGELLGVGQLDINEAIEKLKLSLEGRGVALVEKDNSVTLGTGREMSELIETLNKEELNKDLSKAALETLSIILYKNGTHRALIDYIRGVNSSFTLRALSTRGLIEKETDPNDTRRYIYKPTFELLSYMGVTKVEDLPDYEKVNTDTKTASQELEENLKEESLEDDE